MISRFLIVFLLFYFSIYSTFSHSKSKCVTNEKTSPVTTALKVRSLWTPFKVSFVEPYFSYQYKRCKILKQINAARNSSCPEWKRKIDSFKKKTRPVKTAYISKVLEDIRKVKSKRTKCRLFKYYIRIFGQIKSSSTGLENNRSKHFLAVTRYIPDNLFPTVREVKKACRSWTARRYKRWIRPWLKKKAQQSRMRAALQKKRISKR